MNKSGNALFDGLAQVALNSAQKNTAIINKGLEMWREQFTHQKELSRLLFEGGKVLSRGVASYFQASTQYSARLIEIGRTLATDLLASADASPKNTLHDSCDQPACAKALCEIKMRGKPGELCRSFFLLESNKSETVSAHIRVSCFTNAEDDAPVSIPLIVNPLEVSIHPGEKIRFATEVGIPEKMPSGIYHALIWIDGFPDVRMRAVLSVDGNTPAAGPFPESRDAKTL
jgi:hypothetical protein